jgi:hypothetical protein
VDEMQRSVFAAAQGKNDETKKKQIIKTQDKMAR